MTKPKRRSPFEDLSLASDKLEVLSPESVGVPVIEGTDVQQHESFIMVKRDHIHPWKDQPRKYFSEADIEALANDFQELGFRGTIVVRSFPEKGAEHYQIIDGERSWRAADIAGIDDIPCMVADLDDASAMQLAIAKNHFREELSALELTEAIIQLIVHKLARLAAGDNAVTAMSDQEVITFIRTEMHPRKVNNAGYDVVTTPVHSIVLESVEFFGIKYSTFYIKYMRLLSLPEFLQEAHMKENVPYEIVLELDKLRPKGKNLTLKQVEVATERQKQLLERIIEDELSVRDVHEEIKSIKMELEPKLPAKTAKLQTKMAKSWKSLNKPEVWQNKALTSELEELAAQMEAIVASLGNKA